MHSVSESTTDRRYFCSISCSMNSVCSRSSFTRDSCWIRSLQPQTTTTTVNLGLYDQYLHVGLRFYVFYFIFCKALSGKQPIPSHAWSAHVGLGYATDVKRCKFKKIKKRLKKSQKAFLVCQWEQHGLQLEERPRETTAVSKYTSKLKVSFIACFPTLTHITR